MSSHTQTHSLTHIQNIINIFKMNEITSRKHSQQQFFSRRTSERKQLSTKRRRKLRFLK